MIEDLRVGIEWEPQFLLEEWPKRPVNVDVDDSMGRCYVSQGDSHNPSITLNIPYSDRPSRIVVDLHILNLEVRSYPVPLSKLQSEIEECYRELKQFVIEVAKEVGGIGVFLPRSTRKVHQNLSVSKHLNLSVDIARYDNNFPMQDVSLATDIMVKPAESGSGSSHRLHLRIPYQTVIDEELVLRMYEDPKRILNLPDDGEKPYLIGWSRGTAFNQYNCFV